MFRFRELIGHSGSVYAMEFSNDETLLISGSRDRTFRLWSLSEGYGDWKSTAMETKHEDSILCLAFSPENNRILSGGWDKKLIIRETST